MSSSPTHSRVFVFSFYPLLHAPLDETNKQTQAEGKGPVPVPASVKLPQWPCDGFCATDVIVILVALTGLLFLTVGKVPSTRPCMSHFTFHARVQRCFALPLISSRCAASTEVTDAVNTRDFLTAGGER